MRPLSWYASSRQIFFPSVQEAQNQVSRNRREPFAALAQSEEEQAVLSEFGRSFLSHVRLPPGDRKRMEQCFSDALLRYREQGLSLQEALRRLDPEHLGGFYARPAARWFPLDEAAVIYPINLNQSGPALFRLAFTLKEEVQPALLKVALAFVIKRFPTFATVVRRGFFWHYLDTVKRFYEAEEDSDRPLRPEWIGSSAVPSFRVLCAGNRIAVECFHVLTDGSGGTVFLKTLVAEYLRLAGADIPCGEGILNPDEPPAPSELRSAFRDTGEKGGSLTEKRAVQMSGRIADTLPCRVLHFEMSREALAEEARRQGVTVTAFLSVLIYRAVRSAAETSRGVCRIQIPVNMRKFQDGIPTLRNDSMYGSVEFSMDREDPEEVLFREAGEQLRVSCSRESMEKQMTNAVRLKRAVRFIPLFIKGPVERAIFRAVGIGAFTTTLSNLGVLSLPEEMARHISRAEFILCGDKQNRAACALVTLGNKSVLSVTESTVDPSFSEALCRELEGHGLNMDITGSLPYES